MRKTSFQLLVCAATTIAITTAHTSAPAQRAYQRFWKERMKKMEQPEIVEDQGEERDLQGERYLYPAGHYDALGWSAFPGTSGETPGQVDIEGLSAYTTAALASEMGNPTSAIRAFDEALKKDPESTWMKLRLAQACMMLNDLSRAQSLLEEILKKEPENFRAMLHLAEIQSLKQQYKDATVWYNKVLELRPRNVMALLSLAQISFEIDRNMEAAKKYADQVLLIDDGNVNAMLYSAQASAVTGDIQQAAALYVRLVRYRPGILDQMAEVARRLAARDRIDDARVLYEKAMLVSPKNDEIRKSWEQIVERQGGADAVRQAYDRLIVESRNDLQVFDLYADYLKRTSNWDALATLRTRALEIDPQSASSLLDMAEAKLQKGDFEGAEPFYNRAIEANDADPDVYRQVAKAFVKSQKYDRAAELLNHAIELNGSDIDSMMSLALLREKLGNPQESERLLKKALEVSPVNSEVLRQLGSFYLRRGDRRTAAEYYSQAINTRDSDLKTWLGLAQLYMEDEDKDALDRLELMADGRYFEQPEFYHNYGLLAEVFGDHERARRALEKGIKIDPGSIAMRATAARAYSELGLPDLAVKVLNDIDPYIKDSAALKRQKDEFLATLYIELNRLADAQKILEAIAKSDPANLEVREQLIFTLSKQGKDDAAKNELNNVTREFAAERPVDTQLLRAAVYRAQGDSSRAVGVLKQLLTENPDNHEVWFQLALCASDTNDLPLAEQYYKKLIDLGPAETNSYYETSSNNLGYMLSQNGIRLDEAEKYIKQAQEVNPNAAYILDSLGWLYMQKNDLANARIYLEKAAKRSRDAEVYSNLGQLYEKLNEKELAREYYDKALQTDPTQKLARERRDALAVKDSPDKTQ
ncbi:tetratricopeptide repeat protein [Candidatus Sumerlaeota bacterium]|nr:tetratricopeptide repeat protein [Candidatus Sumerlaeota bacterium]